MKRFSKIFVVCILSLLLAGCSKATSETKTDKTEIQEWEEESTQDTSLSTSEEEDAEASQEGTEEDKSFVDENWTEAVSNLDDSKEFTMEENAYQVYQGTLGEKNIVVAVWMKNNYESVTVTIVGEDGEETLIDAAKLEENIIGVESDTVRLAFTTDEIGSLIGVVALDGESIENLNANLTHINFTGSEDERYGMGMGENDIVENFAAKIKEAVLNQENETLAGYISYPLTMHLNGEEVTVSTEEEFVALKDNQLYGDCFMEEMQHCISKFMFCNQYGIMLGSGQNNIWFQQDDSVPESFSIIGVNESSELE